MTDPQPPIPLVVSVTVGNSTWTIDGTALDLGVTPGHYEMRDLAYTAWTAVELRLGEMENAGGRDTCPPDDVPGGSGSDLGEPRVTPTGVPAATPTDQEPSGG